MENGRISISNKEEPIRDSCAIFVIFGVIML